MAIPYEQIVVEDLNLGSGTLLVSMPGGGQATGTRIGFATFARGWVHVDDYGATPLHAASGTPADSTAAIVAALATGKNVQFGSGRYGCTGGTTVRTNFPGQIVQGMGAPDPTDAIGGTMLVNLSVGNDLITLGSHQGCGLRDIGLDGNGSTGHGLRVQSFQGVVSNVQIRGTANPGFGLYLWNCNLMTFYDVNVKDSSYGGILNAASPNNGLYCTFVAFTNGQMKSGLAMHLTDAIGFTFYNTYHEHEIRIDGSAQTIRFLGHRCEQAPATIGPQGPVLSASALVIGVTLAHGRILNTPASTFPMFDINGAAQVTIDDLFIEDDGSLAGRVLVHLNGAAFVSLSDLTVYQSLGHAFVMVSGDTAATSNVSVRNVQAKGGAAGSMVWWVTGLSLDNCNMTQSFLAGQVSQQVFFTNVNAAITPTNAVDLFYRAAAGVPAVALTLNSTTPKMNTSPLLLASNSVATGITNFTGASDGREFILVATNGNTTIKFSTSALTLLGNGGADFVMATGSWMHAVLFSGIWYCDCHAA